jgi:cation diffusion facilitator family transporter
MDIDTGFIAGSNIAKLSFLTLLGIGIAEIVVGIIAGSMVLFADGIDSLGDATISLIVWIGLHIIKQDHSKKGLVYYKIESFAALLAAIGMVIMGIIIAYNAINNLINPHEIEHSEIAMITIALAAIISGYRAYQMRSIAKKYNLLSLKTDANNSIKDSAASVVGFFSLLIASQIGFTQMDSIGALVITAFIFSIAYIAIRESSLILLDIIKDPKIIDRLKNFIESNYNIHVLDIYLKQFGPYIHGEIQVEVKGDMKVIEFDKIVNEIEKGVKKAFPVIKRLIITAEPA